jgi:hypothetical protein
MKRLLAVICLAALSTGAWGQTAPVATPSPEQVRRLLEVMKARPQMELVLKGVREQLKNSFAENFKKQNPYVTPEMLADFNDFFDSVFSQLKVDDFVNGVIPVYQKHLTAQEVDGMIQFYSSPLGQSVLEKMPALMNESMQVGAGIARERMAKAERSLNERAEQLKRKYGNAPMVNDLADPASLPPKK